MPLARRRWAALSYGPGAASASPSPGAGHIEKALQISMLPKQLSYADRFKLVREVGFDAVEGQTVTDEHEAEEIKKAADDAKVRIHSVMNMAHWDESALLERSCGGGEEPRGNANFTSQCQALGSRGGVVGTRRRQPADKLPRGVDALPEADPEVAPAG